MKKILFFAITASLFLNAGCSEIFEKKSSQDESNKPEKLIVIPKPTILNTWWDWLKVGTLNCADKEKIQLTALTSESININWQARNYSLQREKTTTGAHRYKDANTGLVFLLLPKKVSLFNMKLGKRLADECVL